MRSRRKRSQELSHLPVQGLGQVYRVLVSALATLLLTTASVSASSRNPALSPESTQPGAQQAEARREGKTWSRATLESLSLEEKAAQMVFIRAYGQYAHPQSPQAQKIETQVRQLAVGGLVLFDSDLETVPRLLNELQRAADIPLLVASDVERGLAFRVRRGTVDLPYAMAVGATGSPQAARFVGQVTARESRAIGIHWALAPVVDVQNNPANPVIHLRSYGEDPELVARLSEAFLSGAQEGGLLTSAKHFPGHGDTEVDSHMALPTLTADRQRLERLELLPFRRAIAAGVDSIMLGHLAVPALDPSGAPASLSTAIGQGLLRQELGYQGLVVTDALEMAGAQDRWSGAAVVAAVLAGADALLIPPDPVVAIQSLVRAVREGQISESHLDASVLRILEAKERLGLVENRFVEAAHLSRMVGRPEDRETAAEITEASITLVRNEGALLPLHAEDPLRLLHVVAANNPSRAARAGVVARELRQRRLAVESHAFWGDVSQDRIESLAEDAKTFTHIVVSAFPGAGQTGLPESQLQLLSLLRNSGVPLVVTSFGSPYLLEQLSWTPAYLCAYGGSGASQRAVVAALLGEIDLRGKLPVTLPELYPIGHGLELAKREMTLREMTPNDTPTDATLDPSRFDPVDRVIEGFLEQKAFPGAVVAVGHRGDLVHLRAYGHLTYAADATQVDPESGSGDGPALRATAPGLQSVTEETIYDLASLTKVIVPTTLAMMLVDEGRLSLEMPVKDFLPLFQGEGKENVTVHQLLTHSSGVDWWAPLFQEVKGKAAYVERIQAMDLAYEPGSRSLYSDLGLILLGEILERVTGQSLEVLAQERIFQPLGMETTTYLPASELLERIAPTEVDPWRGRVLRGEVHDENAFALGGIAPHAGLFGTARDLARFAQMILNGGILEHRRLISRTTVESFTRRQEIADSTRALGWDTKSAEKSSAGTLFSPDSFGHTGFTGTSLWIDPQRQLFVILLTNRVHPTRDNILIRQARPALADAVVRALENPS
ncbi:MAG: serine hydrolase [Deltaproteobacteria bacterium]|nr:serine hydrolase [Deltaproteobacteria bacterium]